MFKNLIVCLITSEIALERTEAILALGISRDGYSSTRLIIRLHKTWQAKLDVGLSVINLYHYCN